MAHSQKSIRDHARNRTHPNLDNEVISQQLEEVYLKTRHPVQTWFNEHPYAHESNFVPQLLELIAPKTLLLLDRGFWNYRLFEQLIFTQSDFISRLKSNAQYESISILSQSRTHRGTGVVKSSWFKSRSLFISNHPIRISSLTIDKNEAAIWQCCDERWNCQKALS